MTEEWDRVKALFQAALELAPDARVEYLDRECGGDSEVRSEVDALLAADDRAGGFLEDPIATADTLAAPALAKYCAVCNARYDETAVVCRFDGEPLLDDPELLVNTTLDGLYRVLKVLGRGGFGVVYLARHSLLRDLVAVKVLPRRLGSDPDRVARFLREGRAARALNHPNAVTVYDLRVSEDGTTYMVQEFVDGRTLREELDARRRIPADEALDILGPIASALDEAHAHGIVHRDLKPENIMLGERDGRRIVKLLDLGIAKLREILLTTAAGRVGVTHPGQIIGTPLYMPPEQWESSRRTAVPTSTGGPTCTALLSSPTSWCAGAGRSMPRPSKGCGARTFANPLVGSQTAIRISPRHSRQHFLGPCPKTERIASCPRDSCSWSFARRSPLSRLRRPRLGVQTDGKVRGAFSVSRCRGRGRGEPSRLAMDRVETGANCRREVRNGRS